MADIKSRRALKWITREPNGIMNLPEAKKVGLSGRDFMTEQLKHLYSSEFLDGLNNDQIFDLFEEMIQLPGLTHIGYEKPPKESTDSNIIDLHPYLTDKWWLIKPAKPEEEDEI